MIKITDLSFHYRQPLFAHFDWSVARGETWAVLGPSGCGKSTLLTLLAGLQLPASGVIVINDQHITRPRPQTGLILQDYGLLPWATVRENVALGLKLRAFYGADGIHAPRTSQPGNRPVAPANVDFWLERLGLTPVAAQYPGQLSGGQRQRTAIARTLLLEPDLLLMDEPFASLDAPTRESLQTLTLELAAEQGLTLIIVTHAIEEAALLGGKILLLGEPPNRAANIIENPGAGLPGYRTSAEYVELCRELRGRMQEMSGEF
jgi:ABC-type nitrate/sulfonate/bicarbonate transport system ATPase subunit